MALTELALIRYQALDKCFSDYSKYYFIDDLKEAVNSELVKNGKTPVSERTIYNCIRQMEYNVDFGIEFIDPACIGGKRYYRYADPNFSIWHRDLNELQLSELKSTLLMLKQFEGLPQFDRVQEAMKQLEEHYHFQFEDPQSVIAFDTNQYVEGVEHLSLLFDAIVNGQVLRITYHPFGKASYTSVVHPYYIKQYNGRWFLLGLTTKGVRRMLTNMALDRIESIELATKVEYIENTDYDFNEYFEDIIGVTRRHNDKAAHVVLRFSEHRLPYVLSKPIHGNQHNGRKDEGIIELDIIPNKEFYQKIYSYGADVEILEPAFVREEMAKTIEELYKIYKK
ncbi:MAG: WYL domain-containing protein [Paludibacteraceae bacterium]|nr:WYL domain-containing protein [Paludibacteraceae bacterium]